MSGAPQWSGNRRKALHLGQLELGEIVFGDGDIIFVNFPLGRPLPMGQPHAFFRVVGAIHNNFRCGLAVSGVPESIRTTGPFLRSANL
jgi:hypothetical protein